MHIKDMSLKNSGRDKIEWVRSYMPVLSELYKEFRITKPFAGLNISMSIHLEAKTANLALLLKEGGANVFASGCNPLSTQDDVAAGLASAGVDVNAVYGVNETEYEQDLIKTLECKPHLVIDDGGDFTSLLHSKCSHLAVNLKGATEETTTGVMRLYARHRANKLNFPVVVVNNADCKHLFDNRYGTGQSVWDGIMRTTNLLVAGKTVVVAGYGWCGKGIAARALGLNAKVVVTEVDYVKAIEAAMDGFEVMTMDNAAEIGDIFITVTGCKDVIVGRHFEKMKDGVLLANAGHFNVEINETDLKGISSEVFDRKKNIKGYKMPDGRILNLLAEGRLVNIAGGDGHPAEIMDMSFALQALCLEYLAKNNLKTGIYEVPKEIDQRVAKLKINSMSKKIDILTDEQKRYMEEYYE